MSADHLDDQTRTTRTPDALDDALPEWVFLIGLHDPQTCAARLAQALVDDPSIRLASGVGSPGSDQPQPRQLSLGSTTSST